MIRHIIITIEPTAKDTNAAITGLPAVLARRALMAACIGSIAPNARAIAINSSLDCMGDIKIRETRVVYRESLIEDRYTINDKRFTVNTGRITYLFIVCLASMLSVACGTAFSLALSISFPVTRQIP